MLLCPDRLNYRGIGTDCIRLTDTAILYTIFRGTTISKLAILILNNISHMHFNKISRSYIDHVFISKDARNTVTACAIVSDLSSNVSDHFPVGPYALPWTYLSRRGN